MKKNPKTKNYKDNDSWDERPRHRVKALRQKEDAKQIERALKRKDYKALAEELC